MSNTQKSSFCGFQPYSYRDFTKQLRQLLQDRYTWDGDGFTILKELIQNANDAGATSLHLGWSPPLFAATSASSGPSQTRASALTEGPHPLLTVPALFAVNNGPLRASDAVNITRLGSNSKAGEASSAGRFGLGLKSVFHLCEAFFYLAQPFEEKGSLCSIFNPWSPPRGADEVGPYEHWDFDPNGSVAKSIEATIRSRLEPIFGETSSFCLWIPLRDQRVLKGDALVKRYLSGFELGQILEETTLHPRLAELLPLLHGLREISVWISNEKAAVERRFRVSVDPSTTRPANLPEPDGESLPPERQTNFSGKVIIKDFRKSTETACGFVGAEAIVTGDSIRELWRSKNWPSDESLDPVTNKWRDEPHRVKLIPHGALRFMATPKMKGVGKVSMHWCVFLPLGKSDGDEHLDVEAAIGADVSVFLHGYFFIDAGRTRHVKSELPATETRHLDAESLQRSWNTTIEREAIWPLLLEAFAAFVSELKWDDQRVEELTRALKTLLIRTASGSANILPIVCRTKQWLYILKAPIVSAGALGYWTLKTSNAVVHEMPRPASSIALYDLFPGIATVGSDRALTLAGWPRISADEATPWSVTVLKRVVGSVVPAVLFTSREHIEYFARFLEHCVNSEDQRLAVGETLWPLLKKAFEDDSFTLKQIEEFGATFARVLEFVPEEHRLVLSWASSDRRGADDAFHLIAKDECDLLPIPWGVKLPMGRDCKTIPSRIVVRLLRAIEDMSLDTALLADVISDLLKRADVDRETFWQSLNDARLIVIYDCGQRQATRRTWLELSEQKRRRLVFCDQAGLTQLLQGALGDAASVWRIEPTFAEKVLGDKHGLPGCSARECAAVLAPPKYGDAVHFGGAELGAWEERRELIKKLAGTLDSGAGGDPERLKEACRLLIHGRTQNAYFNATLFLAADGRFDALAEKLVRQVLAKRLEEWRILAGQPAIWVVEDGLTTSQQKNLDLYSLVFSEPAVLDALETAKSDQLKGLDISKDEYAELLSAVDSSRNELLKRLPIHPVAKGKHRVAIESYDSVPVLWDDGYELDSDLTESITLLALDKRDKRVADRQRDLAPVLDREQALRLALRSPQPEKHWLSILKAIEKSAELLPNDVIADLRMRKWFPTRFGARNRDDLICLTLTRRESSKLPEEFTQGVTLVVEAANGAWIADWMLDEKLFDELARGSQAACKRLFDWGVLPSELESLQQLGYLLGEDKQNRIGYVPFDLFPDWLDIEWEAGLMPCHQLLRVMRECFGIEQSYDPGATEVREPIADFDRLVTLLKFLGIYHHHARTRDTKERTMRIFRRYLEFFVNHPGFKNTLQLAPVRFLSRAGTWESSAELCLPTDGIAAKHVLSDDFVDLLSPVCGRTTDATFTSSTQSEPLSLVIEHHEATDKSSALQLNNYFRPWESHVPHDVIGGFVSLLGGDPAVEQLASRYLGKRSLDETRRNLRVSPSPFGKSQIRMPDLTFEILVVHGNSELMTNLLGQQFRAALADNSDSVLVGFGNGRNFDVKKKGSQWCIGMRLRSVDFSSSNISSDASQLLARAGELLLEEVFIIQQHSISDLVKATFQDLQSSDQLEIRVTQQLILEDAELLLSQLGLHADELLGPVISNQTRYRRLRAERSHNQERFGRVASWTESEIDDEQNEANRSLRRLLEEESSGGPERTLRAVRERIQGHNQYNPSAVPFELFQNADDAAVERTQWLRSGISATNIDYFVSSHSLAVRHFGRCVNQVPPDCDPRDHKLADDLRKMLTLWLSNKDAHSGDQSSVELTGKFGLGFKSVFLVSDAPKLLSGRISCEFVGGVFPRYLDLEQRQRFNRFTDDLTDDRKREVTVIELPLRHEIVENGAGAVMSRFREMAHLLVVFARQIRVIQLNDDETGGKYETSWRDQSIPGLANCFKGSLRPLPSERNDVSQGAGCGKDDSSVHRAIVLRTSRHSGAFLLAHDGQQFTRLTKEVPTFWVTAPTREALDVGIALNAHFSLDPGRSWLGSESTENEGISADLGRELGQTFTALCQLRFNGTWENFCESLGLDKRADEYLFWKSLWELLGSGLTRLSETSNAAQLLLRVLWDSTLGALRFYRDHPVLPTCVSKSSEQQQLVALRDVRLAIDGVLAEGDGYEMMCIRSWPMFKERLGRGAIVSERLVISPLRKLCPSMAADIKTIDLAIVLDWEIPNRQADAASAGRLGQVIYKELISRCQHDEGLRLREILGVVRFLNREGAYVKPETLVIGHLPHGAADQRHHDERARAAFAPKNRVLNSSYDPAGIALFEACRETLMATASEMAQWVFEANNQVIRQAALWYLAEGELGRAVQREINLIGIGGTWLEKLADSEEFQSLEPARQGRLLEIISIQRRVVIVTQALFPQPNPLAMPLARHVESLLEEIYNWWSHERGDYLRKYEQQTFPDGGLRNLNRANNPDEELFRKDWVTLFLLGLTHTMGRTIAGQHRDFVRKCERDGMLRKIATSDREPAVWMGWADDFLNRQNDDSPYLQWMKQFIGIYQVSRHLDDYIGAFEAVDSGEFKSRSFGLTEITNLRSSHHFSGSNFDAPPLSRVLGMGQCFVLRELIRNGVLTNSRAYRHCYVPTKRVRDLLAYKLGCEGLGQQSRKWELSEQIYNFLVNHLGLEHARFHHCFDLPFQIIAENEDLQDRFFKQTLTFDDDDSDS